MQERTKASYNSPGFHAHLYFAQKQASWDYVANKLTTVLSEEDIGWKKSTRQPNVAIPSSKGHQLAFNFDLYALFKTLADRWSIDTEHMSNLNKAINHPAYQQIIGMGKVAPSIIVPLILRELAERPDHWFAALHEITGADPVGPEDNFPEAVRAWQEWGKQNYPPHARSSA